MDETKPNGTSPDDTVFVTFRGDNGENKLPQRISTFFRNIKQQRNLVSFWILGLTSNFAFVVVMSAAQDILDVDSGVINNNDTNTNTSLYTNNGTNTSQPTNNDLSNHLICNPMGTGIVLLSAIIPELCVKTSVQFSPVQLSYRIQVVIIISFVTISFILLAFGYLVWLRLIGVVCASVAVGLGEQTFLSLTSFYHRNTVSAWSSGTGAAGLLGSLAYASSTSLGATSQTFMLVMLVVPVTMATTYAFLLKQDEEEKNILEDDTKQGYSLSVRKKLTTVPSLLKYLIPLSLVYFGVYFINQGLLELLYLNNQILSRPEQYRWYQVIYRIGAFVSRSIVNLVQIKRLWTLPATMFVIVALLLYQVFFRFIPYLPILMVIVLGEGFLNGIAYVNTFFCVTNELDSRIKEFALGFVASAGPLGILLAGVTSVPFHNYVCSLNLKI